MVKTKRAVNRELTAQIFKFMKFELDFFSECFACFKSYSISAFNFNLFPSLRVTAFAGFAIDITKCSEANQGYLAVSFLQAFCHPINERI